MSTSFCSDEGTPIASEAKTPAMLEQDKSTGNDSMQPAAGGMLHLFFKVRNFSLLFGGQTISILGDALYMVALPWLILTTGGNAQELGIVLTTYGIPLAVSMLAGGWLSDRLRPRRVMLLADTLRLLLVATLAALALMGHPTLWQFCAIAVPLGALRGIFTPASMAMLPDTLSKEDLQAGNGLMMASMQGSNLVGSAIAGVVVAAFSAGVALAIDAASFLVSAVSLVLMRGIKRAVPSMGKEGAIQKQPSVSTEEQGVQVSFWQFLRTSRLIQITLLLFVVISIVSGGLIEVALPALVHGPMHSAASGFGFILAGWGAGSFVGSLFAGMLGKLQHKGVIILLGGLVVSAMIALLPVWGVPGATVCMLIGGISNSGFTVLLFTAIQMKIPGHLMGRVMGLLMFSSSGLYPLSVALAGVLSNQFGPALLFPFGGLVLALALVFGMTQKVLREV